ncbi:MAG: hypothetical protein RL555_289 [Bacteroidota bacterium]
MPQFGAFLIQRRGEGLSLLRSDIEGGAEHIKCRGFAPVIFNHALFWNESIPRSPN